MEIIISNNRDKPIYEQINEQIKGFIISGKLSPADKLPSMRALAKDLGISIITVQRAYEDLQNEGFIVTEIGRGTFVADANSELIMEERLKDIEKKLEEAVEIAKPLSISCEKLVEILKIIYLED